MADDAQQPDSGSPRADAGLSAAAVRDQYGHSLLHLSHVKRSPHWSFPSKPPPESNNGVPGPGSYPVTAAGETTVQCSKTPRGFTFGLSGREVMTKSKTPGPDRYNLEGAENKKNNKKGIAYSMASKSGDTGGGRGDGPGPGAHEIRSRFGDGPRFTASPKNKTGGSALGPGPCAYDVGENETIRSRAPKCCFGTADRLQDAAAAAAAGSPGPGSYSLTSVIGQGPQVSIKSRFQAGRLHATPGPGAHVGHYTTFGDYNRPVMPRGGGPLSARGAATVAAGGGGLGGVAAQGGD